MVEFDVALGDDEFTVRVELLKDSAHNGLFRANIWRTELYRIQSTFPQDPSTGEPAHQPSDEVVLIDWSTSVLGDRDYRRFAAENDDSALEVVLEDVRKTINHALGG